MSLVKGIFEQMPRRFMRDKAAGVDAVIQYDVRGEGGGTWHVTIREGTCTVGEGPATAPRLTLQISTADWLQMIAGKQSPQAMFMSGKLRVKGDLDLALKLPAIFRTRGTRAGV